MEREEITAEKDLPRRHRKRRPLWRRRKVWIAIFAAAIAIVIVIWLISNLGLPHQELGE